MKDIKENKWEQTLQYILVQCLNTRQLLIYNVGLWGRRLKVDGSCGGQKPHRWSLHFASLNIMPYLGMRNRLYLILHD